VEDRAKRKKLNSKVDFIVDADIIVANSVDVSETGISFQTDTPIKVKMRLGDKYSGGVEDKTAELIWAKKEDNGATTYGLHFIEDEPLKDDSSKNQISVDADIW
jgi:hypothetical protein